MALGLDYSSGGNGSGEIVPYVKYDSRAGRFFRNDRTESNGSYSNSPIDITSQFKAVFDLENIEVGFLKFSASTAPQYKVVSLGQPLPAKPADDGWKQGVRIMMKLHQSCGGDVREISGNAAAFLRGFDELHTTYESQKSANAGKLPIVTLKTTVPITSGSGDKKSTNYQPVFEIVGWATRPADLKHIPKVSSPPTVPTNGAHANPTPPATGSTQVPPPVQKQHEPAAADNDFG